MSKDNVKGRRCCACGVGVEVGVGVGVGVDVQVSVTPSTLARRLFRSESAPSSLEDATDDAAQNARQFLVCRRGEGVAGEEEAREHDAEGGGHAHPVLQWHPGV